MGQKSDKFVQHDRVDDRSSVYKQSTTAPSTAKTDHSPVSCKTDGETNKGFWRRLAGQDVTPEFQKYQMFTTFSDPHFPLWIDLEPNNDAVQNPVAGERDLDIQLEYYENPSMFGLGVNFGTYEMFGGAKPGLANREDLKDSRWAGLFFGHENRCCWRWAHTQIRKDGWIRNAHRNQCWSRMPGPILIPNPPLGKVALLAAGFAGTTVQDDLKAEDPADGLQTPVHSGSDDDPGFDLIDDGGDQIPPLVLLSHEKLEDDEDPNETKEVIVNINGCRYKIGRELGAGGFGRVFEGTRVHDDLKVALKVVEKTEDVIQSYIKIPGYPELVPLEIGLHLLATTGEHVPLIIELLDWMDHCGNIYMILERPSPCEDVLSFVNRHGGITENMAKAILRQAIEASEICFKRGVFHRDLKLNNFLINPNTLEVKLIDFGAGDIYKTSTYKKFIGTEEYVCPEYFKTGRYYGKPATVYSLGVMLFFMGCGYCPSTTDLHQIKEKTWRKDGLSKECCDLIQACLQWNPDERIHLEKIIDHAWFKDKDTTDGLQTPVYSGSDDVIQYPDDAGSDVSDDGDIQIPPLPLILLSHEWMEDDEDPNVTTEKCCDLIQACLQSNPDERIHLEKILDHAWFKDKDPADGLQTPVHSGSDDVIQYPDDAGSDGSDDGDIQIPPLPLISVSHEWMDDDEGPNVTTEIEINGRQAEIDRMVDKGGFGAVNEGTCVKDCLKVALKVAGKNIIRLLPDLLRMI